MELNETNSDRGDESAEWLANEIEKEKRMALILEHTMANLKGTNTDLQRQLDDLERTEKEWKDKYEKQVETNRDLKAAIDALKAKMRSMRARKSTIRRAANADLNILIRKLEKEKTAVEREVRDIEWRLDQESKAYCKALESKKKCITDLNQMSQAMKSYHRRHHIPLPRPLGMSFKPK